LGSPNRILIPPDIDFIVTRLIPRLPLMATTTAAQQAAQQKEMARKLEEYIEK